MASFLLFTISPAFITLLLFLFSLITLIRITKRRSAAPNLPPGDLGLPWIGETMEFFRASQTNRLYEDFIAPRLLKHRTSAFKTRLMGSPTVVVSGEPANRFFLSNEFKLVVSSWPATSVELMGRSSIMEKRGDPHRLARGIVTGCFAGAGMEALVPAICKAVKAHLKDQWGGDRRVISLFRSAKVVTFRVVCECLLEMEAAEETLEMFERVLEGVFAVKVEVPGTRFWRAKRARKEIERVVVEAVRRKRKEVVEQGVETTSLMGRLVAAMVRGEMSEEEVVDNAVLLVFAAIDTTSFAMSMTFKMLAHHPHCHSLLLQEHERIRKKREERGGEEETLRMEEVKEMKYTWQVVRETLRLHPPIFGSFRKAITDIHFDGFFIPKGWKVLWTTYGTHKSEEYFKNAELFDPTRFEESKTMASPYVYVPFGGGPRSCAGYQLSKLNIMIYVHYVVCGYEWSMVNPDEEISVNPLPVPSQGMPITISPKT